MVDHTYELSRRQILAGVGTIGVAGAGMGLGTSALFSDEEQFTNNQLVAGELDMKMSWEEHYFRDQDQALEHAHWENGELVVDDRQGFMDATLQERFPDKRTRKRLDEGEADPCEVLADIPDDRARPLIELEDVKPGDFGEVTFDFALCDNPGFLWLQAGNASASENGVTEPEADATDEDQNEDGSLKDSGDGHHGATVELLDELQVTIWHDDDCDNLKDDSEKEIFSGSLRDGLARLTDAGLPIDSPSVETLSSSDADRGCFASKTRHCIGFKWELPRDVGRAVQTDSVRFDLGFYTEQCRNNDGSVNQLDAFLNDDALFKEQPIWTGSVADRTGDDPVVVENNALTGVDFPGAPDELPLAFDPLVVRVSPGTTVRWEWKTYGSSFPPFFNHIPHNVVALDGSFDSGDPVPASAGSPVTFSHTFPSSGTYLYYCRPHGAPFFVGSSPGVPADEVLNEVGMRGAVIVE